MSRTISDIKNEMTESFMLEEAVQKSYGFEAGTAFDDFFSKVSIESIFFYVAAACMWSLEKLFDYHKQEVTTMINELKPHSLRWYVSKAKAFMLSHELLPDGDTYDTAGLVDSEIAKAKVVKYAAAVEKAGVVYLKVAGDNNGEMAPLSDDALDGLTSYIKEVKDAGVIINIVNEPAEHFRLGITIFYDPMVMNNKGINLGTGEFPVHDTIKSFIKNLPFNGEYRNVALVDELQQIEGVVIPELKLAETSRDGETWFEVDGMATPYSGYYKIYKDTNLNIAFKAYETISQ